MIRESKKTMNNNKEKLIGDMVKGVLEKEILYGLGIRPREAKIMRLRAVGNTYEEIAASCSCSRQRVHQIIQRVARKRLKQDELARKIAKKIDASVSDVRDMIEWEMALNDIQHSLEELGRVISEKFRSCS